jgi:ribonuclease BN (tRNA processing enzyme)
MNIRFLGVHNRESQQTVFTCLLIDDTVAIDAGALSSSLSFEAQRQLVAVLLTHRHYDHIRDIPGLAMNCYAAESTVNIYGTREVYDALSSHLFDGQLYPNFLKLPPDNPVIRYTTLEPYRKQEISGYDILPLPVTHSVPTVGYQITSEDGKSLFYTADTGPGLIECWQHVSPQLLIIEVTLPDKYRELARTAGHLTPGLLQQEMTNFHELKGYLPQIVTVHMDPESEAEIQTELDSVAEALDHPITRAYAGMLLSL